MTKHALGLDLLVVLVFAVLGRASHDLDLGPVGILTTAWPFLFGLGVGWLLLLRTPQGFRRWWVDGAVLVASALAVGMTLRWASGEGTATAFVLVATGVLSLGLLGWRAVEALVVRTRARPAQGAGTPR